MTDQDLLTALSSAGFVSDDRLKKAQEDAAEKDGMNKDGDYVVEGVWTRGIVTLAFEQNTSPMPAGDGLTALIRHPSVCVVSSSRGRVAVNPNDVDLLLAVADDLS